MDETVIEQIAKLIEADEGYRQHPYKDSVGILTVGIGRNLISDGISYAEAVQLELNDVRRRWAQCESAFEFWDKLSQPRQYVLINMSFQLGITGLLKFRKFIKAIREEKWEQAGEEMLDSTWARQTEYRAKRLQEIFLKDSFSQT